MAKLYAIGTSVYVRKDGEILILKHAGGAAKGSWYIPGGALDEGERDIGGCPPSNTGTGIFPM